MTVLSEKDLEKKKKHLGRIFALQRGEDILDKFSNIIFVFLRLLVMLFGVCVVAVLFIGLVFNAFSDEWLLEIINKEALIFQPILQSASTLKTTGEWVSFLTKNHPLKLLYVLLAFFAFRSIIALFRRVK